MPFVEAGVAEAKIVEKEVADIDHMQVVACHILTQLGPWRQCRSSQLE